VIPSSETETRLRGRSALDRDGASREGGVQPPSEAESRSGGRLTLERDETSPEGATVPRGEVVLGWRRAPRAEWSSARGWLGRFSGGPWVCFARAFRFVCVCLLRV
jgi:hypothetical protein